MVMAMLQEPTWWWCPMCGSHGWGMMWMWLFWLVVIAAVLAIAAAVLRRRPPDPPSPHEATHETPRETLRRRYAAGEIDRETYHRMLEDLGESDT